MIVQVDPKSSVPVFQQIAEAVKSAIAKGVVAPGEAIPSVRQMAAQALVNPNTVARAYRDLEREGVVITQRGLGVFAAADAKKLCRDDRRKALAEHLAQIMADARQSGISIKELRAAFQDALRELRELETDAAEEGRRE